LTPDDAAGILFDHGDWIAFPVGPEHAHPMINGRERRRLGRRDAQ